LARIPKWFLSLVTLLLLVPLEACAQGRCSAASCNYSDVNAVINGPTHTAVNDDTIVIPWGTCTWTSTLSINVGITVKGAGSSATIIDEGYAALVSTSAASHQCAFSVSTGGNVATAAAFK
jgi:hypothetical protein